MTNGEFEIFDVRQRIMVACRFSHQTVAYGGGLPFAFAFARGEYIVGGLLELVSSCFSIGDVLLFVLSCRVQRRGADVIGRWNFT